MKTPLQAMRDLLAQDSRFKIEAYQFIRESLQYAHEHFDRVLESSGTGSPTNPEFEAKDYDEKNFDEPAFDASDFSSSEFDSDDFDPTGFDAADFDASEFDASSFESDQQRANHITGQQLCEACRQYAIDQYGYLARIVLSSWGIHSTGDFGELVYNLIRIEQMRKSESDRREDFDDVYDFESAFDPTFELSADNDS